jgi:hypothetical protein
MGADGLILDVRYRAEAGERLATVLAQHIGGKAALLIDSRVRNVVFIAGPVSASGQLTIATDVTGAEAERMTKYVRARWPAPNACADSGTPRGLLDIQRPRPAVGCSRQ